MPPASKRKVTDDPEITKLLESLSTRPAAPGCTRSREIEHQTRSELHARATETQLRHRRPRVRATAAGLHAKGQRDSEKPSTLKKRILAAAPPPAPHPPSRPAAVPCAPAVALLARLSQLQHRPSRSGRPPIRRLVNGLREVAASVASLGPPPLLVLVATDVAAVAPLVAELDALRSACAERGVPVLACLDRAHLGAAVLGRGLKHPEQLPEYADGARFPAMAHERQGPVSVVAIVSADGAAAELAAVRELMLQK
jgi:ribosomal protein L7Ae-like RNA K-turn-binding protein